LAGLRIAKTRVRVPDVLAGERSPGLNLAGVCPVKIEVTGETRGIGLRTHLAIVAVLLGLVVLASVIGRETGPTAAALAFVPALALLGTVYLLAIVIVAAVPALRRSAGRGLMIGFVLGSALLTVVLAIVLSLA
jgi:hypothetical protein